MWGKPKCNHSWTKQHDELIPSFLERSHATKMESGSYELCESTHIIILTCDKCGLIDKTITKC